MVNEWEEYGRIDMAEDQIARGFSIFPLAPNSKIPLPGSQGFKDSFNDYDKARDTWYDNPQYNIGIATGEVSNLTVIDLDGEQGLKSFEEIKHLFPMEPMVVKTPGGYHLYFEYNPGFHSGAGFLPGVDVRNDGGYVVAPGSIVTDPEKGYNQAPYKILRDVTPKSIENVPEMFLKHTRKDKVDSDGNTSNKTFSELLGGSDQGTRDNDLVRFLGTLGRLPINQEDRRTLAYYFADQCRPTLDYSLVDEKLDRMAVTYDFTEEIEDYADKETDVLLEHATAFLNKEVKPEEYLVDNMLAKGTLNVIGAYAKVGKSTLTRQLSVCVAQGKPFLGREVEQGAVLYLALEEQPGRVYNHFKTIGLQENDPLYLFTGRFQVPYDRVMTSLRHHVEDKQIKLLVIDTISRMPKERRLDMNDYVGVSEWLEPYMAIAHELNVCLVLIYHQSKGGRSAEDHDTVASLLGSTAIPATADQIFTMRKEEENQRSIMSEGRIEDLPRILLEFDHESLWSKSLGLIRDIKNADKVDEVWQAIRDVQSEIDDDLVPQNKVWQIVKGSNDRKMEAIRTLESRGYIKRISRQNNSKWFKILTDYNEVLL
tara:strand:+ start:168 stop:1952 length:1785 start_codon:yes stop_codon:yes gene_type:complete